MSSTALALVGVLLGVAGVLISLAGVGVALLLYRRAARDLQQATDTSVAKTGEVQRLINTLARALEHTGAVRDVTWDSAGNLSGFIIAGEDRATVRDQAAVRVNIAAADHFRVTESASMVQHPAPPEPPREQTPP